MKRSELGFQKLDWKQKNASANSHLSHTRSFLLLVDGANLALQLQFAAQHSGIQNQSACTFGIKEWGLLCWIRILQRRGLESRSSGPHFKAWLVFADASATEPSGTKMLGCHVERIEKIPKRTFKSLENQMRGKVIYFANRHFNWEINNKAHWSLCWLNGHWSQWKIRLILMFVLLRQC